MTVFKARDQNGRVRYVEAEDDEQAVRRFEEIYAPFEPGVLWEALGEYHPVPPGQAVEGGIVLQESEVFGGDHATRPYVVRLVVREHPYHPFVIWVYYLDEHKDRAHGDYHETLKYALKRFDKKCRIWQVNSN